MPSRAHVFWTAAISGKVRSAIQSVWSPRLAPATAYVPIPLGSSSDAPVMKPGPRIMPAFLSGFFSFAMPRVLPTDMTPPRVWSWRKQVACPCGCAREGATRSARGPEARVPELPDVSRSGLHVLLLEQDPRRGRVVHIEREV